MSFHLSQARQELLYLPAQGGFLGSLRAQLCLQPNWKWTWLAPEPGPFPVGLFVFLLSWPYSTSLCNPGLSSYPTLTVSKVSMLKAPALCEVTARPARLEPLIFNVILDPAISVQLTPSGDV